MLILLSGRLLSGILIGSCCQTRYEQSILCFTLNQGLERKPVKKTSSISLCEIVQFFFEHDREG